MQPPHFLSHCMDVPQLMQGVGGWRRRRSWNRRRRRRRQPPLLRWQVVVALAPQCWARRYRPPARLQLRQLPPMQPGVRERRSPLIRPAFASRNTRVAGRAVAPC